MTPAKQCKDRFEDIVALVMGELNSSAARELQVHIAVCDKCRAAHDALVEEEREVRSGFEALARSLGPIEQSVLEEPEHQSIVRVSVSNNHFLQKAKNMILTHKRLSAATAATLTALAASLILYVFSSSTPAYALEQTAQANDHVTTYHIKTTPNPLENGASEAWVELDSDGAPLRARMDISDRDQGDRVIIESKSKFEIWSLARNTYVVSDYKEQIDKGLDECTKLRPFFDPKLAFEALRARKESGTVQVLTKEPVKAGEPVTLTVTSSGEPDVQVVYEVDPKTKLVERITAYRRHGDRWKQVQLTEYLDYNEEIDPRVFQPELPKDVIVIDQTKIEYGKLGLPQGDLTDDQIATKVAKEFTEALISGDYEKASRLSYGIPGDGFKKLFEQHKIKLLRIVEVGKPTPSHDPRFPDKRISVPVQVELEQQGTKIVKENSFGVGPVPKHPERWSIDSGF